MPQFESTKSPTKYAGFYGFRVGTCEGLWRSTPSHYEILAVVNKKRGNGHFKALLGWFEQSCRRDNKKLLMREVWNPWLAWKCYKYGWKWLTLFNWEKSY